VGLSACGWVGLPRWVEQAANLRVCALVRWCGALWPPVDAFGGASGERPWSVRGVPHGCTAVDEAGGRPAGVWWLLGMVIARGKGRPLNGALGGCAVVTHGVGF
jgi:hypothetical protein